MGDSAMAMADHGAEVRPLTQPVLDNEPEGDEYDEEQEAPEFPPEVEAEEEPIVVE